jgi:predicted GNAT family N-acyltransferase
MEIKEISVDNPAYQQVWQIREDILRKPLGMTLADDDLSIESDPNIITILAAIDHGEEVIGCLILQRANSHNIQIRQVAVSENGQGKGVGRLLMKHAETMVKNKGFTKIFLHSRVPVREFYEKLGYKIISEEYLQIGIPHVTMEKKV